MKRVILCDLGGVLVNLNWSDHVTGLFGQKLSKEELREKWFKSKATHELETGHITFEQFYEDFCKEIGKKCSYETFSSNFDAIINSLKDDSIKILKELKSYGTLALLSNLNPRHFDILSKTGIFDSFDWLFFSHIMHMVKPDLEIFEAVRKAIDCAPNDIYFFDDSPCNIEAAKKFGFNAYLCESPQEILAIVKRLH